MATVSAAAGVRSPMQRRNEKNASLTPRSFGDQPTSTQGTAGPPSARRILGLGHDFGRLRAPIRFDASEPLQKPVGQRTVQRFGETAGTKLLALLNKILKPPMSWKLLGFMSGFSEVDPSLPFYVDLYRSFLDEYDRGGFDESMMAAASYQDRGVEPTKPRHRYVTMKWSEIRADIDLDKRTAEETMKRTRKSPEELQEMQNQATRGLGGVVGGMF